MGAEAFATTSKELGKTQIGEVFEVIEGPRKEDPLQVQRIKGKAAKDGKIGWTTLKDAAAVDNFELTKVLVCKSSIAITNSFDIATGKAIRKLEVGEVLDIVEEPKSDESRSLLRVKAKSQKDGKEGWVTMKGNQGTAYVEETSKHYKCVRGVDLEGRFGAGTGPAVRTLEVGELFEVQEGPKMETKQGANRVRGRNVGDGKEGWFTLTKKNMQPWQPSYRCSAAVDLFEDVEATKPVRKLEAGERLEALEPPTLADKDAGIVRIRLRAETDSKVGFATIKEKGTVFLEPLK